MAFVYWIRLPEHTDVSGQGYIGFTSQPLNRRMASHWFEVRRGTNNKLYNAMRKYSEQILTTIIHEGSVEDCLALECTLRPVEMLGWNHGVGGVAPSFGVSPSEETIAKMVATRKANPRTVTEETRKKLSEAGKGREVSEDTRKKISEKAKLRPTRLSWNVPRANKKVWGDRRRSVCVV